MMIYNTHRKDIITIHNLDFVIYLSAQAIQNRVRQLAQIVEKDYKDKNPMFLVILNGAFIFAADIIRNLDIACDLQFIKATSYKGLSSTGKVAFEKVEELKIANRNVILIEDIIDSGLTAHSIIDELNYFNPKSVEVCTLLKKRNSTVFPVNIKYKAFDIPNRFVVGYGLDFDGGGRNLPHIYEVIDKKY